MDLETIVFKETIQIAQIQIKSMLLFWKLSGFCYLLIHHLLLWHEAKWEDEMNVDVTD